METIGVRELRQNASEYLRRVAAGESITVTDRGKPVAVLIPPQRDGTSLRDQMIASGALISGGGGELPEPLPARPGPTPSDRLRELRDEERY